MAGFGLDLGGLSLSENEYAAAGGPIETGPVVGGKLVFNDLTIPAAILGGLGLLYLLYGRKGGK